MPTNLLSNKNTKSSSLTSYTPSGWKTQSYLTLFILVIGSLLSSIYPSSNLGIHKILGNSAEFLPGVYNSQYATRFSCSNDDWNTYRYQNSNMPLEKIKELEQEEGFEGAVAFLGMTRAFDHAVYKLQAILAWAEKNNNRPEHKPNRKYHYKNLPRLKRGIEVIPLRIDTSADGSSDGYTWDHDCNAAVVLYSYINHIINKKFQSGQNMTEEEEEEKLQQEYYKNKIGESMLNFILLATQAQGHDDRYTNEHQGIKSNNGDTKKLVDPFTDSITSKNEEVKYDSVGVVPELFEHYALTKIIGIKDQKTFIKLKQEFKKFYSMNFMNLQTFMLGIVTDIYKYIKDGAAVRERDRALLAEKERNIKFGIEQENQENEIEMLKKNADADRKLKNAEKDKLILQKQTKAINLTKDEKKKYVDSLQNEDIVAKQEHKIKLAKKKRESELQNEQNEMDKQTLKVQALRVENQTKIAASQEKLTKAQTELANATSKKLEGEVKLIEANTKSTQKRLGFLAKFLTNKKMLGILGATFIIIYFLYKAIPYILNAFFKPVPDVIKVTSLPTTWSAWIKQLLFGKKKPKSLRHLMVYNPDIQTFVDEEIDSTIKIRKHNKKKKNRKNKLGHDNLLLFGPPGTGKTFLATQMAILSGMDYIIVDTPAFAAIKDESEAVAKAKEIFSYAKQRNRDVMIIFDEFDAVFSKRASTQKEMKNRKSRDVDTKITNVFLNAVEKMNDPNVKIIGITNLSNIVDPAIQRRFRLQLIDKPTIATLKELLKRYMEAYFYKKGIEVDITEEELDKIAKMLDGKTGSHVQGLVSTLQAKAKTIGNNKVTAAQITRYLRQTSKKQESY